MSKFLFFPLVVLAAGIWTVSGLCLAAAESVAPGVVTSSPQQGAGAGSIEKHELDALRAHLDRHWKRPADTTNPQELVVRIRINLKPDGTLASPPVVLTFGTGERFFRAREDAVRAVFRSQPFKTLSPATYEKWKQLDITFDPRDTVH